MRRLSGLSAAALLTVACGGVLPEGGLASRLGNAVPRVSDSANLRVRLSAGTLADAAGGNDDGQAGRQGLDGIKEIIVSINKVTAHSPSQGWVVLMENSVTIDLLKLGQYTQELGFANMPAGKITQIRLYITAAPAAYVITTDDVQHPLKVPSALRSGIKIHGPWNLAACDDVSLDLLIDPAKSIHIHGRGADDTFILRPVIRLAGEHVANQDNCVPPGEGNPFDPNDPSFPGGGDGDDPAGGNDPNPSGDDPTNPPEELCYSAEGMLIPCDDMPGGGTGGTDPSDGSGTDGSDPNDGTGDSGNTGADGTDGSDGTGGTGDTGDGSTTDPADGTGTDGTDGTDGTGDSGTSGGDGTTTDGGGTDEPMECMGPEGPYPC